MTKWLATRVALAAAVLAALPLAGCGGGNPVNTGPFGGASYGGMRICSKPLRPHSVSTIGGIFAFRNSGPAAVIDKVSLTGIRGLRLLAAYTVPTTGHEYGNYLESSPPPARDLPSGIEWSRRQRAGGARIPPSGRDYVDLVLVVQLLGKTGTTDGIDLYYHTSGGQYHMHVKAAMTLTSQILNSCPAA